MPMPLATLNVPREVAKERLGAYRAVVDELFESEFRCPLCHQRHLGHRVHTPDCPMAALDREETQ